MPHPYHVSIEAHTESSSEVADVSRRPCGGRPPDEHHPSGPLCIAGPRRLIHMLASRECAPLTTNAHISVLQRDGKRSGQIWANLKENDSVKPLTAILTLNTISHTVGALGVGSVVGEDGHSSLAVASSLLTLAMLFGSEILPKTIGAAYWKALNAPAGRVLALLTLSLAFIVYPIEWFRNLLPSAEKVAVTRDEISVMADIGEEESDRSG